MVWTRTSRSHDISGPVQQVSVLVVLDGGACPGALQGRAGSTAPPPPPRHTPHHATSKAESATFATTRVVLYPTIRQWNGCPSDKRQLVWSVVHAVKGRTGRSAPRRRARGRGRDRDKDRARGRKHTRKHHQNIRFTFTKHLAHTWILRVNSVHPISTKTRNYTILLTHSPTGSGLSFSLLFENIFTQKKDILHCKARIKKFITCTIIV